MLRLTNLYYESYKWILVFTRIHLYNTTNCVILDYLFHILHLYLSFYIFFMVVQSRVGCSISIVSILCNKKCLLFICMLLDCIKRPEMVENSLYFFFVIVKVSWFCHRHSYERRSKFQNIFLNLNCDIIAAILLKSKFQYVVPNLKCGLIFAAILLSSASGRCSISIVGLCFMFYRHCSLLYAHGHNEAWSCFVQL